MSRTAVLVVNWNGLELTHACLDSLRASGVALEDVVVVDNGSTDGSPRLLAEEHPQVDLVPLDANRGFTGGNNAGIARVLARPEYDSILLLNNDTLVTPELVPRLRARLFSDERTGIVQPKLVKFDRVTVDNTGFLLDRFGMSMPRGAGEPASRSWPEDGFFYASGACMLVRVDVFRSIGLLDDAMFAYHEDVDFCWRARHSGWRIAYVDEAVCLHKGSATAGTAPSKLEWIWRNRFRAMLKNETGRELFWRLPAALVVSMAYACATSAKHGSLVPMRAYVRAIAWNAGRFGETRRLRRQVAPIRSGPPDTRVPSVELGQLAKSIKVRRR